MTRSPKILLACGAVALGLSCATAATSPYSSMGHQGQKDAPKAAGGEKAKPGEAAAPEQPQISNRAKLLFDEAVKAHDMAKRSGKYDYAALENKYKSAIDADENLAEADYNLGVLAERQGNADQAIAHYRNALRKKPSLYQAAENMGIIAQNKGDLGGASRAYEETVARYPDAAGPRARLAEAFRQRGQTERAIELSRQALMRDPKCLPAYKVLMRTYLGNKQYSMARLVALRAMKLDEMDPELYYTVGLINLEEKEPQKARFQFLKAIEVRGDYLPAHVEMARLAMQLEDFPSAEEHLRRVLAANSKNAEAHLDLGIAYKSMGQFDKAMQEYDEAERLNGNLTAVMFNRAIILHRYKDAPERAVDLYKKYLASTPEVAADAEHPAHALMKEAEQIVQAKAEAAKAEEDAKKQAKEQGQGGDGKGGDGKGDGAKGDGADGTQQASGKEPPGKEPAPKEPAPKPAPKTAKAPPKPEAPKEAPKPPDPDEPGAEP